MGKIRVAALGNEKEEKLREKQKVRREEKKKREEAQQKVHIAGMKGGERLKTVGATSEEEMDKLVKLAEEVEKTETETPKEEKPKKQKKIKVRGKKYKAALMKVDPKKIYPLSEAIILLKQISLTHFDASVEVHLNVVEKGLRGSVSLPHGTGKKIRVAIADTASVDKIVESVGQGKIDFDALIATPQVMGKLAKVARFLGPKGLMPNPKSGTISNEPEKMAEKLTKGEINWKTESDFPLIHQVIGELSFKDKQLEENFLALVKSINPEKIKKVTLKSTMSPGIKVQPS